VALAGRYEAQIRASLRRYYDGVSLEAVWRGDVTPDECWDLLMQLPRDSPLMAALAADPDFIPDDAAPSPPPWTEFGPEVAALAEIRDLLASIRSAIAGLGGQKLSFKPYPRPVNLHEQRRQAQRWERHRALTARLIPGKEA
jgi:hypothetical protein